MDRAVDSVIIIIIIFIIIIIIIIIIIGIVAATALLLLLLVGSFLRALTLETPIDAAGSPGALLPLCPARQWQVHGDQAHGRHRRRHLASQRHVRAVAVCRCGVSGIQDPWHRKPWAHAAVWPAEHKIGDGRVVQASRERWQSGGAMGEAARG